LINRVVGWKTGFIGLFTRALDADLSEPTFVGEVMRF